MDGAGQNASSFKHSRSTSRKISTDYGLSRRHDSLQLRRSMSGRDEILEIPSSPPPAADAEGKAPKQTPVTWLSLPRKGQLALLFLSRLFDFLQVASLQAYMFYQLKSFDETLPDSKISWQAGVLQGSFTAAQFATAILWGRVADARWGGRKRVLLIGLVGTGLSCIGLGFSRTFAQAVIFRTFGGAINGTVGIIRTMIAEIIREKKYQSRAFLILPVSFNIAALFGPVMGGLLVNPTTNYPSLFGPNSAFGGKSGIRWMSAFPYALPSIICSIMLFLTATSVYLALEETLESRKYHFDSGIYITQRVSQLLSRLDPSSSSYPTTPSYQQTTSSHAYTQLELDEPKPATSNYPNNSSGTSALQTSSIPEDAPLVSPILNEKPRRRPQLPLRRIWTKNVLCTLLAQAFFDFHMGAFNNLILLFLSTPRPTNSSPLSGGLALPPPLVGLATSLLGILGLPLQLLFYPPLHALLGTTLSYRLSLPFFIPAYALAPLIGFLPSSTPAPGAASGFLVWAGLVAIVGLQVGARTFSLPTSIILLNNCSPHPSVLGTVHGLGQSVSSVARTLGPVVVGRWFGAGLKASREAGDEGVGWGVGGAWWGTAAVAALGAAVAWFVREGSGHEIFVEGDFDEYDAGGGGGGGGEDREVEMELGGFREVEMRGTGRGWAGGGVHSA